MVRAASCIRLTFPTQSQPLGRAAGTGTEKGPHASLEGYQPGEGVGLAAALPSREAVLLPTRALWAPGEAGQYLAGSAASAM